MDEKKETKRERFLRVAEARLGRVLQRLDLLAACGNRQLYEYTEDEAHVMMQKIRQRVDRVEECFAAGEGRLRFSLSEYRTWYRISADGGESWTEQWLTDKEAADHLAEGYLIGKVYKLPVENIDREV